MRCSCKKCTTYMIQADDITLGCLCPNCGERCTACLGTNSVISKEDLKKLEGDPRFFVNPFEKRFEPEDFSEEYEEDYGFEDYTD